MFAQRPSVIVAPEQATALQLRHDEVYEIRKCTGKVWRQDVEPVGCLANKPLLQGVSYARRRAADHPVAACRRGQVIEFAQGHFLAARGLIQHVRKSLAALE